MFNEDLTGVGSSGKSWSGQRSAPTEVLMLFLRKVLSLWRSKYLQERSMPLSMLR